MFISKLNLCKAETKDSPDLKRKFIFISSLCRSDIKNSATKLNVTEPLLFLKRTSRPPCAEPYQQAEVMHGGAKNQRSSFLRSAGDFGERYAGAMSNAVLQPKLPSFASLTAALA